ncbi:MAG: 2-amino-4-hydroxy-6-hydroxymethyldihydropteridine diphosphokinase [Woeseia sp.]
MTAAGSLWRPAYIGLGSNLDEPVAQIRRAFEALTTMQDCRFAICSSLYRSAPMGPSDQPDFINAAAAFLTRRGPQDLLRELKAIEDAHGRERDTRHWGPRTLDLDLLVLGSLVVDEPGIRIPHPGVAERNFVLLPFAEIAPQAVVPGHGSVLKLLAGLGNSGARVERVESMKP